MPPFAAGERCAQPSPKELELYQQLLRDVVDNAAFLLGNNEDDDNHVLAVLAEADNESLCVDRLTRLVMDLAQQHPDLLQYNGRSSMSPDEQLAVDLAMDYEEEVPPEFKLFVKRWRMRTERAGDDDEAEEQGEEPQDKVRWRLTVLKLLLWGGWQHVYPGAWAPGEIVQDVKWLEDTVRGSLEARGQAPVELEANRSLDARLAALETHTQCLGLWPGKPAVGFRTLTLAALKDLGGAAVSAPLLWQGVTVAALAGVAAFVGVRWK